jgi:hypothetical protein
VLGWEKPFSRLGALIFVTEDFLSVRTLVARKPRAPFERRNGYTLSSSEPEPIATRKAASGGAEKQYASHSSSPIPTHIQRSNNVE